METFDPSILDVTWDDSFDPSATTEGEDSHSKQVIYKQKPFVQAILIVVDCHDMGTLGITDLKKSLLEGLECFVRSRVKAKENDRIGIAIFGSASEQNDYSIKGIHQLYDVSVPTVDRILGLRDLQKLTVDEFRNRFKTVKDTHHEVVPLSNAFRYALREFRIRAATRFARRLVILSSRADPCYSMKSDIPVSLQLAQDLLRNGVLIDLVPLSATFDLNNFWLPIIRESYTLRQKQDTEDPEFELDEQALKEYMFSDRSPEFSGHAITTTLSKESSRQRTFQKTRLVLGAGTAIGVNVFIAVNPVKKPAGIKMRTTDHRPVKTNTQWLAPQTGESLARKELTSYYEVIPGKKIAFTKADARAVRAGLTGIASHLIGKSSTNASEDLIKSKYRMVLEGFFNAQDFDRYRFCTRETIHFIYGSDELVEGSRETLSALVESMILEKQYGCIRWQYRAESIPRLFCAVPSWTQTNVPGFYLLALPFLDDLRHPEDHHQPSELDWKQDHDKKIDMCWDKLLDSAGAGREPLRNWNMVKDPAFEKLWHGIETLALEEENMDPFADETQETLQTISQDYLDACADLQRIFNVTSRNSKRSGSTANGPREPRRRVDNGDTASMTVNDLKAKLQEYGLKVSGRKAELVERLEAYMKSKS